MTNASPRFIRKETYARARTTIIIALALTALIAVLGVVWLGWWDIAQNRRILSSLPLPPGAERVEIGSNPVAAKELIFYPPRYWSTSATFTIPGYSREYLLDFYISRLSPEWQYCIPVATPGVHLVSEDYLVSVYTEGASSPTRGGSFRVHVSPDGDKDRCGLRDNQGTYQAEP